METLLIRPFGLLLLLLFALSSDGVSGRGLLQKDNGPPPGGFLEDEVPLTVVSTVPEKLLKGGRIAVAGRESLTVVFSRPVIGFGKETKGKAPAEQKPFSLVPDVPGQYRWLTTYIAVFEPAEDWASDLEVEFEWNSDLTSSDGVPFSVLANSDSKITTPALDLRAVAITSNHTNYLTDNFWDAFVGTSYDFLPEMPEDAHIQLLASSPINLAVLQNSLLVVDPLTNGNPPVSVNVKECTLPEIPCADCAPEIEAEGEKVVEKKAEPEYGGDYFDAEYEEEPTETETKETEEEPEEKIVKLTGASSSCVNVTFTHDPKETSFLQGRRYSIVLPSATQYSNDAGPLTRDITIDFAGLRDFRVPFVEDPKFNISNSRLQLWLPHGLGEDVNVTDFPMKIIRAKTGEDVDFSLETVSKSVVRVNANFNPGSNYKISVFESPSFKDGYGLNLKRSTLNFLAAPIEPFFGAMTVASDVPLAIFEDGEDWGEKIAIFSKGSALEDDGICKKDGSAILLWDIGKPESGLPLLATEPLETPITDILGVAANRLVDERTDIAGDTSEVKISKLLQRSGLAAGSYCRNNVYHPIVVCQTQLQVVLLITSAVTTKGRTALVWVTDMKTASPVSDATVELYERSGENDFKAKSDGETDKSGVASLSVDKDITELYAIVTSKGKSVYVPSVEVQGGEVSAISDSVVLDRPIVRPGEWLHVKGYIMRKDGGAFLPSAAKNVRVVISPSMVSRTKESDVIEINKYNKEFGSYTLSFRIPLSVISVHHTITVEADVPGGDTYVGMPEPFSVLDSRRSPAVLNIDAPDWALPNKKLKVNADVTSFAGAPIQDATIQFIWSIQDEERDHDDELLQGRVVGTTNGNGEASATIDLTTFVNAPSAGTILTITAHYTGSSGERVKKVAAVRLELADVDIVLEKTVDTDIPLQEFGIRAAVFNLQGKRLTSGGKVAFSLKQISPIRKNGRPTLKPSTAGSEIAGKAVEKCEQSYKSTEFCTFALPKMGEFVVEACVKVGKSKVCKRSYMGKTEQAWETAPLEKHLPFGIIPLTSAPYTVGQAASFLIENPFEDVNVLMAWGSRDSVKRKTLAVKTGRSTIKFEVDSTCSANCALSLSAAIPRQKKGLASKMSNPVNAVFDPALPHTEHYTTVIETKRQKTTLAMTVSLPGIKTIKGMPLMEPGVNASVKVTFDRKGPVEITAFAIDTAILDVLPYPLKDVSDDFIADLSDYFRYKSTSENMVAPGAIDAITKANEARKKLDPWFKMISTLQPSEATSDIQLTDDQYLEQYVQYLTVVPRTPEQMAADAMQQSIPEKGAKENETAIAESNESVAERPSYVTPNLFESFTASGGVWLVNFEGPPQGGEFAIRAYASSGTGLFGNDEVRVRVKRSIAVKHDFPTFARLGDKFETSITISTLNKAEKPISFTIDTSKNLKMTGPDELNIQMGKSLQKEIRLNFMATAVGEAVIKLVADDGVGHDSKTTIGLTVYGPQPPVVLGNAFPVSGSSSKDKSTEMVIPQALEGSGSLVVTAGQGYLPGLLLLADQIYSQDSYSCPISADFVLASIAIPAIIDVYYLWSPDPNLLPEFYVELVNAMLPAYQRALSTVYESSTSMTLGLETEVPCQTGGIAKPTGISLEQNAKGIFIINEVEKRLREHNLEDVYKNTAAVFTSRKVWMSVLEEGIVEEAAAAREEDEQISTSTVAVARLALGAKWAPPKGTPSDVASDLSMARLKKEFDSMSVESQAYYILAILGEKKVDKDEVKRAFASWEKITTTAGSKAYVTTGKDSVTAESSLANSLVFLAMVRGKASDSLVKQVAYYVTAPISDPYGFNEYSIYAKTVAMIGLSDYDARQKTKKTNVRLELRSGTIILFSASFTPGRHPVSAQSTSWKDLGKSPGAIEVFPQGDGEVNVAVAMKYVPSDPLDNPIYKGIFVDRIIQMDVAGTIGQPVSQVPLGTVVNVRVHFMTPEDLKHTTVQVSLPAGLEPVQLGGNGAEFCPIPFFDLFSEDFYPSCPEQITLADQVQFVYESVSAGAHTVAFKAVAAISGSYGVPPARVFVTDTPSIMGMSSATRLDICKASDKKCTTETAAINFIPTECKNNCNGNGVCDLSSGKCSCFYGFGGDDCQKVGAA